MRIKEWKNITNQKNNKMQTTISNRIIRKLNPCYDPAEVIKDENEKLPVKEWVTKYRDLVKDPSDIIWLLCNKLFMSDKDIRLFAVWNAREILKLVKKPNPILIDTCNVSERYANGEATEEELNAACDAALAVWYAASVDRYAASTAILAALAVGWAAGAAGDAAAWATSRAAASAAGSDAAIAARDAQIDKLVTYFK